METLQNNEGRSVGTGDWSNGKYVYFSAAEDEIKPTTTLKEAMNVTHQFWNSNAADKDVITADVNKMNK